MYPTITLTPAQRADMYAQARRQAQLLRRAAIADFWHAAYRLAADALRAAQHVLQRAVPRSNHPSGV